jgi:protein-tyrosine phosphatase
MSQHFQEIVKNLYLGDAGFVFEHCLPHFSLIVNMCPEINCDYSHVSYDEIIRIKILDSKEENEKWMDLIKKDNVLEKINKCLAENKKVILHCAMGISRSPSLTACYLIKFLNLTVKDAVKLIKQKRKESFETGFTFLKSIVNVEYRLLSI